MCDEFYHDPSEFEEAVESLKDDLRSAVKQEVQQELEELREQNWDYRNKLRNLEQLEGDAKSAKHEYEVKIGQAKLEAKREVQEEGLRSLLQMMREPRWRITYAYEQGPKCDRCDDYRHLNYTTPRGREEFETCECAKRTRYHAVEEMLVHEVTRRNGNVMAWYDGVKTYFEDDHDFYRVQTVLKNPETESLEQILAKPHDYGFRTQEVAQDIADRVNEAERDG